MAPNQTGQGFGSRVALFHGVFWQMFPLCAPERAMMCLELCNQFTLCGPKSHHQIQTADLAGKGSIDYTDFQRVKKCFVKHKIHS